MYKDIKDYYNLYIGASVFIFTDESITDGFLDQYRKKFPNGVYNPTLTIENYKRYLNYGYKLILRPLSDMKDDEKHHLALIMYCENDDEVNDRLKYQACRAVMDDFGTPLMPTWRIGFHVMNFLIKQHFDIFELIKNNLAIDKTIINS